MCCSHLAGVAHGLEVWRRVPTGKGEVDKIVPYPSAPGNMLVSWEQPGFSARDWGGLQTHQASLDTTEMGFPSQLVKLS